MILSIIFQDNFSKAWLTKWKWDGQATNNLRSHSQFSILSHPPPCHSRGSGNPLHNSIFLVRYSILIPPRLNTLHAIRYTRYPPQICNLKSISPPAAFSISNSIPPRVGRTEPLADGHGIRREFVNRARQYTGFHQAIPCAFERLRASSQAGVLSWEPWVQE